MTCRKRVISIFFGVKVCLTRLAAQPRGAPRFLAQGSVRIPHWRTPLRAIEAGANLIAALGLRALVILTHDPFCVAGWSMPVRALEGVAVYHVCIFKFRRYRRQSYRDKGYVRYCWISYRKIDCWDIDDRYLPCSVYRVM